MAVQPFQIEIPDTELEDLRRRLRDTRSTAAPAREPWESGVDYRFLEDLVVYWGTDYDWREHERRLNSVPQYTADIDGQVVHFAHVRADPEAYPDAIPIVLSHGWPYSFIEFLDFSRLLTDPLASGGTRSDAFDVVVPSLPGFGYSRPLDGERFTGDIVARLWRTLMTEDLGYQTFATYGEDVGATVSDWLAASFPESVVGLFATHAAFPPEERSQNLTAAEQRFRSWLEDKWRTASAYAAVQATRPDTLAVGLNDSPAGLLAWMVEKFHEWSGPDFETSWTRDDLVTTTSLYWFTRTIGSSFLDYFHGRHSKPLPMVNVPVGVAVHRGEYGFPREYAERTYTDVRTWAQLENGGHFTAKQSPRAVADAMREFFSGLRR